MGICIAPNYMYIYTATENPCNVNNYMDNRKSLFYYLFCTMTKKNAQLFHKLSHSYMFRHYHFIFRKYVINSLPSYTSISNAAVGNTIYK